MTLSLRARLAAWYTATLVVGTTALAAAGAWLLDHSVRSAADASLQARLDGVRAFIVGAAHALPHEELIDEFKEYVELSMGAALLEVTDAAGARLCQPGRADWAALTQASAAAGPRPDGEPITVRAPGGDPFRLIDVHLDVEGRAYHVIAALPMAAFEDAVARFRRVMFALLPVLWVAAGIGGYALSRRALAPVGRMTGAAQAITVRELHRRLDVPAAEDELRRLAVTFNEMLARLEAAVADLTRLTAEASHELRTPVTLIRTTAEVALGRERPAVDYRDALVEIAGHAERMSTLVDDLLTLARADAGVEAAEPTRVDLAALARQAAREMQPAAAHRGLALHVEADDAAPPILAPRDSLPRLLRILIDNALKYTDRGGRVIVRVAQQPPADGAPAIARLEVDDTGIGVDPAERAQVFERFYRSSTARARDDGAGLGLAIARTIVGRLGGSIVMLDGPDGRGSRVRVEWQAPLADVVGGRAGIEPVRV